MRYREFGVSTIESDRNRILEQSSHGLSDVFGVSSPACQGKAQYEYSLGLVGWKFRIGQQLL